MIGTFELDLFGGARLGPGSGNFIFRGVQSAIENTGHDGNLEMECGLLLRNIDGGKPDDVLVQAVECSDEFAVGVVRNVELKPQAHAVGDQSALPQTFYRKQRVVWLMSGRFSMKVQRQRSATLGPLAVDHFVVGGNFALELRTNGSNFEFEGGAAQRDGACLNRENGLVQAVQGGMEIAMGIAREMKHEMELCIPGLKRTCIGAFQRGRLRVEKDGGREETKSEECQASLKERTNRLHHGRQRRPKLVG